jgi:hypothetical protein
VKDPGEVDGSVDTLALCRPAVLGIKRVYTVMYRAAVAVKGGHH